MHRFSMAITHFGKTHRWELCETSHCRCFIDNATWGADATALRLAQQIYDASKKVFKPEDLSDLGCECVECQHVDSASQTLQRSCVRITTCDAKPGCMTLSKAFNCGSLSSREPIIRSIGPLVQNAPSSSKGPTFRIHQPPTSV